MSALATVRGLAIAAAFCTAGSLASSSLQVIPSILSVANDDAISAQTMAAQFAIGHRIGKITQAPAELFSTIVFGILAWDARRTGVSPSSWKLYAGACAVMFSVLPWTITLMEQDSQKIVALTAQPSHATDKEAKLEHGGFLAPSPPSSSTTAVITPIEEFEPYEDAPFSGAEYEKLKIRQLLQTWNTRNIYRIAATALAGGLAFSAITTRIALVTIVQGQ